MVADLLVALLRPEPPRLDQARLVDGGAARGRLDVRVEQEVAGPGDVVVVQTFDDLETHGERVRHFIDSIR